MRKYFLITEKGCRYLLYRVNGLTRAHIEEWFGKTPEKVANNIEKSLIKTVERVNALCQIAKFQQRKLVIGVKNVQKNMEW